jgi:hypothetical protein
MRPRLVTPAQPPGADIHLAPPPPYPPARWAHAAAAVGPLLFAYGGVGQVVLDELAVLDTDLMTWRALKPRAPAPRDRPGKLHAAAMAAWGRCLWLFGGQQGRRFLRGLHALDTDSMTWALAAPAGTAPAARAGHTLTAVGGAGVFLFGGQGKRLLDDMHLLTFHGHGQGARHAVGGDGGAAAVDDGCACSSSGGSSFSGSAASGASGGPAAAGAAGPSSAPPCEWVAVRASGAGPSARRGHSATYDGRGSIVVFGGSTASSTDNGLWLFSVARREWRAVAARGEPPAPRTHHSAVLLRPGRLLIFGGCNAQGVFFQVCTLLCCPASLLAC